MKKSNAQNLPTSKIGQKGSKAVAVRTTPEKALNLLKEHTELSCAPKTLLKELGKAIDAYVQSEKPTKKEIERLNEQVRKAAPVVALETHHLAAQGVAERQQPFVIAYADQLIEEYKCETPSERMLAENIALAYGRTLMLAGEMTSATRLEYLSKEKNGFFAMISNELDRAQRQLTASLLALKQMKNPSFNVNVKAKAAFIAQNQQINVDGGEFRSPPDAV